MASFVKYNAFVQDLGRKVHNLNSDTLKIALTNTAPTVATNAVLADITEISAGNGYSAGGTAVGSSAYSQTSGTATLSGNDVVFTASGGTIGAFRYAVLYNDTSTSDSLIGYWDYGSSITLQVGETFTVDFGASIFTLA
jgi:hypothetical protein